MPKSVCKQPHMAATDIEVTTAGASIRGIYNDMR